MKLKLTHKKPASYHLFYPADEWSVRFLKLFNMAKPPRSFTVKQVKELKALGFQLDITSEAEKYPEGI